MKNKLHHLLFLKKWLLVAFVTALPLQFISAQADDSLYFPLRIGNSWHYNSDTITDSEAIVDSQRIGNLLFYRFDRYRGESNVRFALANRQAWQLVDNVPEMWYDFSANSGDSWTVRGPFQVEWTVTLLSKSDTVVTPAGTFSNCYRFYFAGIPDFEWEEWFAPGEGLVKRHLYGFAFQSWELFDNIITDIAPAPRLPAAQRFALFQNYPNPFNPETNIEFRIAPASAEIGDVGQVSLIVYDILGRQVITLINDQLSPGFYRVRWDGRNARGEKMVSGPYFYQLIAGEQIRTKKMVLIN